MNRLKNFLLFCGAVTFICSCAKKKIPKNDSLLGLDYYPTDIGKFVVYDVDSTVYKDLPLSNTNYRYRIKEKITNAFTDNEGKEALRLERYIKKFNPNKPYDSIPYVIKEVWMINATKKSIQISERDIRYTKLIFPIQQGTVWNGNAFNTLGNWDYNYDYIDKKETFGAKGFDKVLKVEQKEFVSLISLQRYTEKYAKGVGLVYREITDITSNNVVSGVPIENRIETGVIYKQTIIDYGKE